MPVASTRPATVMGLNGLLTLFLFAGEEHDGHREPLDLSQPAQLLQTAAAMADRGGGGERGIKRGIPWDYRRCSQLHVWDTVGLQEM